MKRDLVLSLLLAVSVGACEFSYFAASVDVPEICVTDMELAFPAVPAPLEGQMGELETSLETQVGEEELGFSLAEDLDLALNVLSVGVAPAGELPDLSFVEELAIDIGAMGSDLPSVHVVDLAPEPANNGGLYGEPTGDVDITAFVREGELVLGLQLRGALPAQTWETRVDLCLDAHAGYVAPIE